MITVSDVIKKINGRIIAGKPKNSGIAHAYGGVRDFEVSSEYASAMGQERHPSGDPNWRAESAPVSEGGYFEGDRGEIVFVLENLRYILWIALKLRKI